MQILQMSNLFRKGHLALAAKIPCRHASFVQFSKSHGSVRRTHQIVAKYDLLRNAASPFLSRGSHGKFLRDSGATCYAKGCRGTVSQPRWICFASASSDGTSHDGGKSRLQRVAWTMAKAAGGLGLVLAAFILALPSILSTRAGLRSALAVANRFVPGTVAVKQVCSSPIALQIPGCI